MQSRRTPHPGGRSIDPLLLDKPCYKRSNAKGNDIDIRPPSKKRKLRVVDLQVVEQKLFPPKKKKRSGFSFPKGPHFPVAARLKMPSELMVTKAWKVGEKGTGTKSRMLSMKVLKSGQPVQDVSTSEAVTKEEAANLAILETLYD